MQRLGALWEFAEPKGGCRATAAANKTYDAFTMRCEAALVQQKKKRSAAAKGAFQGSSAGWKIPRTCQFPVGFPVPRMPCVPPGVRRMLENLKYARPERCPLVGPGPHGIPSGSCSGAKNP